MVQFRKNESLFAIDCKVVFPGKISIVKKLILYNILNTYKYKVDLLKPYLYIENR